MSPVSPIFHIVSTVIKCLYFGEGMETNGVGKKVKKERNDEILFKNCVYTCKLVLSGTYMPRNGP